MLIAHGLAVSLVDPDCERGREGREGVRKYKVVESKPVTTIN